MAGFRIARFSADVTIPLGHRCMGLLPTKGLTLPLVSLAAIFVLRFLGVPIHQMSVTGLIVALGLLVEIGEVVVGHCITPRTRSLPIRQAGSFR